MLRFTSSVAWLTITMQCFAQEALPRVSFLSSPVCGSVESEPLSSREEIKKLLAELPQGMERDIALQLLNEVSGGRLKGFCRDPQSGEFVAAYASGKEAGSSQFRVALGNRSLPRLQVDVAILPERGGFGYAYRLSNGVGAMAPIRTWGLMTPSTGRTARMTHPSWLVGVPVPRSDRVLTVTARESTAAAVGPTPNADGSDLSRWQAPSDRLAIQAGESLSQFALTSDLRPGWTMAYVGSDDAIELPQQELSEEVKAGLDTLSKPEHYFTPVLTIGPKFGPGTGRTWIAGDWHVGVQMMVSAGQLSAGSPYVAKLLGALAHIAASAPEAQIALEVGIPPSSGAETLLDKAVRMALR